MPNPDIGPLIEHMKDHGSSLNMGWGEDGGWEVAWITGGRRFCGFSRVLATALVEAGTAACVHHRVPVPDVMRDVAIAARLVR